MNEPEIKPAKVPLLYPDPVIEYYLAKVDRYLRAVAENAGRAIALA